MAKYVAINLAANDAAYDALLFARVGQNYDYHFEAFEDVNPALGTIGTDLTAYGGLNIEGYNDWPTTGDIFTTDEVWPHLITTPTDNLKIYAAPGNEHTGVLKSGGLYTGYSIVAAVGNRVGIFTPNSNTDFRIQFLAIDTSLNIEPYSRSIYASGINKEQILLNSLVKDYPGRLLTSVRMLGRPVPSRIEGNVIYGPDIAVETDGYGQMDVIGNVIMSSPTGMCLFLGSGGTSRGTVSNNYLSGGSLYVGTFDIASGNNASDVAIPDEIPGTDSITEVSLTDGVNFVAPSVGDFHLSNPSSLLYHAGQNLYDGSGNQVDIDGVNWPNSVWDVGVHYLDGGGSPVATENDSMLFAAEF